MGGRGRGKMGAYKYKGLLVAIYCIDFPWESKNLHIISYRISTEHLRISSFCSTGSVEFLLISLVKEEAAIS